MIRTEPYAKARSVFDRKKKPEKPIHQKAAPAIAAPPPLRSAENSTEKNIAVNRETVRQEDGRAVKAKIPEPAAATKSQTPSPTTKDRDKTRKRDTSPRLSREELDLMIGRQRQQREERNGPSR